MAFALLAVARPAFADEAAAKAHFKKGIDFYDRKQYGEALAAFQDAYKEKPSAAIKQNIALSLKGLNRLAEAARAFDEAIEEGKDTLKPETRAAIERELTELSKSVATVNISVVTEDKKPVDAVISVLPAAPANAKPQPLPPSSYRRIRLMPGIYTFTAHAPGYPDPPEKRFALVSGAPVDATFVMGARPRGGVALGPDEGALKVETNVPEAVIRIDGVDLPQRGTWSGMVKTGPHHVEVSAPGWKTTSADVTVSPGASVDYPLKLQAIGEAPPEYVAPGTKAPPKKKRLYIAFTGAADTVSYRLAPPLDEPPPYGTRRSNFGGLSVGGRGGYLFTKMFAVELLAELGGMAAKYKVRPNDSVESSTKVVHWQLTPTLRFMTPDKVRFTAATGFGVHGLGVESKLARPGSTLTKKGQGVGFSWLIEAGMQADMGPLFLELAIFLDVHGVGSVRDDDAPEGRLFYASPSTRGGLRVGLGIPF
jgi:hypothetical protein